MQLCNYPCGEGYCNDEVARQCKPQENMPHTEDACVAAEKNMAGRSLSGLGNFVLLGDHGVVEANSDLVGLRKKQLGQCQRIIQ